MSETTKETVTVERTAGAAGVVIQSDAGDGREQTVAIDHTPAHAKVIIDRERKGTEEAGDDS